MLKDVLDATSAETYATLITSNQMKERQERFKQIKVLVDQERAMYMEMLSRVPGISAEHRVAYYKLASLLRTTDDNSKKLQELLMFFPEEKRAEYQKLLEPSKQDKADNRNQV